MTLNTDPSHCPPSLVIFMISSTCLMYNMAKIVENGMH